MAHFLGEILGYLFMLVWVPYAGWTAGRAIAYCVMPSPKVHVSPKATGKSQVKPSKKTSKSDYQVIDSFRDEHRITNPVEFDA
tara:strand:+ start:1086 stop:1334 length:249 start_codon:yes stop_codon:yes gene_type:complete